MTELTNKRDTMLANFSLSGGPDVAAAFGELLGERDRLRAQNAERAGIFLRIMHLLGDAPIRAERDLPEAVADLIAERDRLRAVVEAARAYGDIMRRDEIEAGDAWLRRANDAAEVMFAALDELDASGR